MAVETADHLFETLSVPRAPRYREAAYGAIKEAILDTRLSGEEPLVEERIGAALGISRTPVREALAILEHEGLIAPRAGKGLFIRALSREEFFDMFGANEVIEPYLASRAAERSTNQHLAGMQSAIERGRNAATSLNLHESLRSGREFHFWLGSASGSDALRDFVVRNEEQTDLYLLSLGNPELLDSGNMETSNNEHLHILEAIRNRDSEYAAQLVIDHAQSLRARWASLFESEAEKTCEHIDSDGADRA